MKKRHLLIAAVVTMPLLGSGEALAGDRYDRETFYYGLSKDGYRVVIAYGDNDRRDYRDRRPVRYVTHNHYDSHHYNHGYYGHKHSHNHGKAHAKKRKHYKHKHAHYDNHNDQGHGHGKRGKRDNH